MNRKHWSSITNLAGKTSIWHDIPWKTQSVYVLSCVLPTDSCSKACSYVEITWLDLTCPGLVWLGWAWLHLTWLDLPWLDLAYLELRWVDFEVNWIWTAPSWMKLAGVASETKIESLGLEVGIGHANCTWTLEYGLDLEFNLELKLMNCIELHNIAWNLFQLIWFEVACKFEVSFPIWMWIWSWDWNLRLEVTFEFEVGGLELNLCGLSSLGYSLFFKI